MNTHTAVREKYGSIANDVATTGTAACCSPQLRCCDPITKNLYNADEQEFASRESRPRLPRLRQSHGAH